MENKHKDTGKKIILAILGIISIATFAISVTKLILIHLDYKKGSDLYEDLNDNFVKHVETETDESNQYESETQEIVIDSNNDVTVKPKVKAPLEVDWEGLRAINEDIVGWIYVEATPEISYPILQGPDDAYYVDYTFDKQIARAGCIFMSYLCNADFTSPQSLVYGHNMNDGSMFSPLYLHRTDGIYDENPYFWVLTPDKNLRYEFISCFEHYRAGEVYKVFYEFDESYEAYLNLLISKNQFLKNPGTATREDRIVTLISCVPQTMNRTLHVGKLIQEEILTSDNEDTINVEEIINVE